MSDSGSFIGIRRVAGCVICLWLGMAPALLGAEDRVPATLSGMRSTLTGSVHRLAVAKNDVGRVPAATPLRRMILELKRSAAQQQELDALTEAQQDANSPSYHRWLTPDEFGSRFGVSAADRQKIAAWLAAQGLRVERVGRNGGYVIFNGNVSAVEKAFNTEMHRYRVNGVEHMANSKPVSVPVEFSGVVAGVRSLNNFFPRPQQLHYTEVTFSSGVHALSPADFATIYDLNPLYAQGFKGDGVQIAIIGTSNINTADVTAFRSIFGLPAPKLNVIVDGADPGLVPGGDELENINDVSWAGAVAPNATINLVVAGTTDLTYGTDLSAAYVVDNDVAPIVSLSYGDCEELNADGQYSYYGALWQQAAAQGQSVFVASGDSGAAGCDYGDASAIFGYSVNQFASSPYNVAVGGTQFLDSQSPSTYWASTNTVTGSSALSYIPEQVWNESAEFGEATASGGGTSSLYAKPSWQAGLGVPQDNLRDMPDVSLHAAAINDPYLFCESDLGSTCTSSNNVVSGVYGVGGTSLSTPAMAGIMALVNQKTATIWGNPNPVIYAMAASTPAAFHDVTLGNNKVTAYDGSLIGYPATTGYDLATGWGSVDAAVFVNAWKAVGSGADTVSLSASATHVTHQQGVTFTVGVTQKSGTVVPTGPVAITGAGKGIGFVALNNGAASQHVVIPGGTHSYTAYYGGDTNFAAGSSSPVSVQVDPEQSSIQLYLDTTKASAYGSNNLTYGDRQLMRAQILNSLSLSALDATGTVAFNDGGTTLATVPITSTGNINHGTDTGLAITTLPELQAGSHTLGLVYSGDQSYNASTDSYTLQVAQAGSGVILEADHTEPLPNSTVNVTAYVYCTTCTDAAAAMTGTVLFTKNGVTLGQQSLPAMQTSYSGGYVYKLTQQVKVAAVGSYPILATYSGDTNLTSSSSTLLISVTGKSDTATGFSLTNTMTDLSTGQAVQYAGSAVQLSITVAGDTNGTTPSGSVLIYDGTTQVGSATLGANGMVVYALSGLAVGTHTLTAVYQGDTNFTGSQSTTSSVTVVDYLLSASTNAVTVTAGQTSSPITLTLTTNSAVIANATNLVLNCSGLPSGVTCEWIGTPAIFAVGSGGYAATATVAFVAAGPTLVSAGLANRWWLLLLLPAATFLRKRSRVHLLLVVVIAAVGFVSLGGCSNSTVGGLYAIKSPGAVAGTYTVTVNSTLASDVKTQSITLTVKSAAQ